MNAWAQSKNKLTSYEGRHFIVAFMQNEITLQPSGNWLEVYFSATQRTSVTIRGINNQILYNSVIPADSMVTVGFQTDYMICKSEEISASTIDIESEFPITIYGKNSIKTSSDMFAAIPVTNWGNEYMVVSYPNDSYKDYPEPETAWGNMPRCSEFLVVAAYDNTIVKFTPTVKTWSGKSANVEQSVTLNKGQAYLVQSLNLPTGGDLSGTVVTSDKPIGLFSGHVRTAIMQGFGYPLDSKDHLCEMLMPVSAWGKNFATGPFVIQAQTEGNLFRLFTKTPNTVVTIRTTSGQIYDIFMENAGTPYEIDYIHEPAIWNASDPIQIAQYMRHNQSPVDNEAYDPSLVMIPPIEQYVQKISFLSPANPPLNPQQYVAHYANLIVEEKALSTLRADGRLVTEYTNIENSPIAGTKYYYARVPLNAGSHTFVADSGSFSGILWGHGKADSYAVVLGSSLTDPNTKDTIPPVIVIDTTCGNINGYVYEKPQGDDVGIDYCYVVQTQTQNYDYSVIGHKDTATVFYFSANLIDPNLEALFTFIARDKNGNIRKIVYKYFPTLFTNSNTELSLGDISWTDSLCNNLWTKNNSKIPIELKSITCSEPRVKIYPERPLPTTLAVDEQFNYKVCVDPDKDYKLINTRVSLEFQCDKKSSIPIVANVIAPDIVSRSFDFGDVLVGEDSCNYVYIINTGNTDIVFTKFVFDKESTAFIYDTLVMLPYTLSPGDSLKIRVCFTPGTRMEYNASFTILNNFGIYNRITIHGSGISPELGDLQYDWLKRRVQTVNTKNFVIKNTGNAKAKVRFSNVEIDDASFDITEFKNMNTELDAEGIFSFNCNYIPQNTNTHHLVAYYIINDDINQKNKLELSGLGTLPTITTGEHQFPTIKKLSTKDSVFDFILSGGNEDLTIDEVKIIAGNQESFELNLADLQNIMIKPDSLIKLPVKFKPQEIGNHFIDIEVVSDAAPNYVRVRDTVRISGNSITIDTSSFMIGYRYPESIIACNNYSLYPFVVNTGNTVLHLSELQFTTNGISSAVWIDSLKSVTEILPHDTLDFQIDFTPTVENINGEIALKASTTEGLNADTLYKFTTMVNKLVVMHIEDFKFNTSDTISMDFSGKFPNITDLPVDLEVSIQLEDVNFTLIDTNAQLIIKKNNQEIKIPLVLEQKNNYIKFLIKRKIVLDFPDVLWQLNLRFKTYFSNVKYNKFIIELNSSECFYPVIDTTNAELIGVCIDYARPFKFIEAPVISRTQYNSVTDAFDMEIEIFRDDKISISLYNTNGELISNDINMSFSKGKQLLSLNTADLADGVYIVSFKCNYYVKNLVFIKNK